MYTYIRRIFIGVLLGFSFVATNGQQVTKEQLLKLFYQAHTAQKANDLPAAIESYTRILKLSPGLPDPYLQLGNLYATMTEDAVALEKACVCYANYIRLKPEASDADALKGKITELAARVKTLNAESVAVIDTPVPVVAPLPEPKKDPLPVTKPVVVAPVAADTVPVHPEPVLPPVMTDDRLLGRWVSDGMGSNGREEWIMDVSSKNGELWIALNDSSFMKKDPLFATAAEKCVSRASKDGDEVVFTFRIEENKEEKRKKAGGLFGGFGTFVSEMLDVDIDLFSSKKSSGDVSPDTVITDSVALPDPLIIHTYRFRVKFDGYKLVGTLQNTVEDLALRKSLADRTSELELFKAPDDYKGFCYKPRLTEQEKAMKKEFRDLLNRKMQEAMENTSALNDLACMYVSGIGIRRNMKMAVAYFMEASMKNNLFAMLNLAQLYQNGLGVDKDLEKARNLYNRAYEKGYTDAMVLCGDSYLSNMGEDGPDYKDALACYQKAAFKRCPYAFYRLGWLYSEGLGVAKDEAKAWEYYSQAVAMQYPEAMTDVGLCYRDGVLVEKDNIKALDWLTKAADKGNAKAMYELSQMYLRGEDVRPDFKYAKEWLHKSMEADDKVIDGYNTLKTTINRILNPKQ